MEGSWDKAGYEAAMVKLVAGLREDLKAPDVPFIAGFLSACGRGRGL